MSVQSVKEYLRPLGLAEQVIEFTVSSATVAEAAAALGCEPARIAKTMSFLTREGPVLIVAAGDEKVDNHKFKETFHEKAKMIPASEVETLTGHPPGGVCPFANPDGVKTYLDVSLKRFDTVYPAAGSGQSAVQLQIPELETAARPAGWVDVCKGNQ